MKANCVTTDGDLIEDVFDVSSVQDYIRETEPSPTPGTTEPSPVERELVTRQIRMEEDVSLIKNMLIQTNAMLTSHTEKIERLELIGKELLRRNPAKQPQGNIVYTYASEKSVAELREMRGQNKNQFALDLEKMVYEDDPEEMELVVDNRIRTKDRIIFIRQCILKFYEIPEHLREDVWRKIKDTLNSRVRRLRKAIRDGQSGSQNRELPHEYEELDRLDVHD